MKNTTAGSTREATLEIRLDNLDSPQVIALVREHLASMTQTSPAESCHPLDLDGLRGMDVTLWSVWDGENLAGIGALKHLSPKHAEIKSMRTARSYIRKGIASKMLRHIILEAGKKGYKRLSLETGSMEYFEPARRLYESFGFTPCEPFGDYVKDPNSVFMTRHSGDESV